MQHAAAGDGDARTTEAAGAVRVSGGMFFGSEWDDDDDDDDDDDVELNVLGCWVDILGTNCDQCVGIVQCCFTSTEAIRLVRTGSPGRPPRLSHSSGC